MTRKASFCLLLIALGCEKGKSPDSSLISGPQPGPSTRMDAIAPEPLLSELTQAVRRYAAEQKKAPLSLDELVVKGYLPGLPQAPAGHRFAIDKNLRVYLTKL